MKKCTKCGELKNSIEFPKRITIKSGLCSWCKDCYNKNAIVWAKRIRREVIEHYGGKNPKCECCGESQYEFLCLDHISGGGTKERKILGKGGNNFYRYIMKANYPKGFRVLCHNCNSALGYYGYCPHKKK